MGASPFFCSENYRTIYPFFQKLLWINPLGLSSNLTLLSKPPETQAYQITGLNWTYLDTTGHKWTMGYGGVVDLWGEKKCPSFPPTLGVPL